MPYICTMQSCEVEKAELRKEIERLRTEVEEWEEEYAADIHTCGPTCRKTPRCAEITDLRAERDALKAELARHYTLSSDEDKYVFDRDMKAEFAAIDAAREG